MFFLFYSDHDNNNVIIVYQRSQNNRFRGKLHKTFHHNIVVESDVPKYIQGHLIKYEVIKYKVIHNVSYRFRMGYLFHK